MNNAAPLGQQRKERGNARASPSTAPALEAIDIRRAVQLRRSSYTIRRLSKGSRTFARALARDHGAIEPALSDFLLVAIVDDDDDLRDALVNLLRSAGFRTVACGSAEEFLDREYSMPVDVLLTDYQMPGLDGPALIKALRARGDLTPVIVMTGASQPMLRHYAITAGAVDFLQKPFDADSLIKLIERVGSPGSRPTNGAGQS